MTLYFFFLLSFCSIITLSSGMSAAETAAFLLQCRDLTRLEIVSNSVSGYSWITVLVLFLLCDFVYISFTILRFSLCWLISYAIRFQRTQLKELFIKLPFWYLKSSGFVSSPVSFPAFSLFPSTNSEIWASLDTASLSASSVFSWELISP